MSSVSQRYFLLWLTQIDRRQIQGQIALRVCRPLQDTFQSLLLPTTHSFELPAITTLTDVIKLVYMKLTKFFDFRDPLEIIERGDFESYDNAVPHYIPIAIKAINNLVMAYNTVCSNGNTITFALTSPAPQYYSVPTSWHFTSSRYIRPLVVPIGSKEKIEFLLNIIKQAWEDTEVDNAKKCKS